MDKEHKQWFQFWVPNAKEPSICLMSEVCYSFPDWKGTWCAGTCCSSEKSYWSLKASSVFVKNNTPYPTNRYYLKYTFRIYISDFKVGWTQGTNINSRHVDHFFNYFCTLRSPQFPTSVCFTRSKSQSRQPKLPVFIFKYVLETVIEGSRVSSSRSLLICFQWI